MMIGEDGETYGWEVFETESWRFKVSARHSFLFEMALTNPSQHDRLGIQKRVDGGGEVQTSDIAHLMELLQVCLPFLLLFDDF